ncbi:aminotransferase class V-fold PLP-dependent enzyme [Alteromonas lipolytica]|uniref:Penicillin epimerase n=1 Tax=Alteromonas lipolytica TaxID=1856405 RepID=A0A1E8FD18_9ALTE|nr:aminotransferase class V-fold PLP-dependent enzyme [Alteromonas lipolytica]OFI33820.1 penicillin epimerase [Alteromonas lipolytica]GGF68082.1 isopenicillin-N epimerase [Alteromonas lipolytica]
MSAHTLSRRKLLQQSLLLSGALASGRALANNWPALSQPDLPATALANNEAYWESVSTFYKKATGTVNLEHGYWGKMSLPVEQSYIDLTKMVNQQLSYYARKDWYADAKAAVKAVANSLAVSADEIALTRNATEAMHNLLFQYKGIKPGDSLLWADIDYPAFQRTMSALAEQRGATGIEIALPAQASKQQLIDLYKAKIRTTPNLKLMLLTHASNQHGLILPVAEIAAYAKQHGVDVICDCAQSWGLIDFTLPALNVDWAVFNLHKWIGSPVGVGALYMRKGTLDKVAPYPGESDPDNTLVHKRVHMATSNFAAFLTVPDAIRFHEQVGPAAKMARLKYLRERWVTPARTMAHIEVLGATDDASASGMGAFRLAGQTRREQVNQLQQRLESEFGVFTVGRHDLASGSCIRVTPQIFTTLQEIDKLVDALGKLA